LLLLLLLLLLQMGQPLPLPSRIPLPSEGQRQLLDAMQIKIPSTTDELYVSYELPEGWQMVNRNGQKRDDLPDYVIVDDERRIRVTIGGAWKGTYDNELWLRIEKEPLLRVADDEPDQDESKFLSLLRDYRTAVKRTAGCGQRGQVYVDRAHAALSEFAKEHPQDGFLERLPDKHLVQDDGVDGFSGLMAALARN